MAEQIIAVDLGGTQIRTARLDDRLNLLQRENTLTLARQGPESTLERIKRYIAKVMPQDGNIAGIGVSSPGPLNPATGVIIAPPNLPGWRDVPLARIIEVAFGLPVYVGNDANVAALAEASKGAAQGKRHVVYITVSTGIGSGVICDGKLLMGRAGLAAELGHIPIVADDQVSSLELEAAGPAIARRVRVALDEGRESTLRDNCNCDASQIDAEAVGQAAAAGDALAIETLAYAGRILGLGIVAALHLFNPEVVVLGGGVTKTGELLFGPMREAVQMHILDEAYLAGVEIREAVLGDDVALVGAGALVATQGGLLDIGEIDRRF